MGYLVGVNKMMFMKSHFVTSSDVICFKCTEFGTFNQRVRLFVKNWKSHLRPPNWPIRKLRAKLWLFAMFRS